jgi:RHS repeat-associated protein
MNGRSFSNENYRFGFNGKERDNETFTDAYDFGARILDTRLGRWLSVDPLYRKYSDWNPYHFAFDKPILYLDNDGRDGILSVVQHSEEEILKTGIAKTITLQSNIFFYGPDAASVDIDRLNKKASDLHNTRYFFNETTGETYKVEIKISYSYAQELDKAAEGDKSQFSTATNIIDAAGTTKEAIGFQEGDNVLQINANKLTNGGHQPGELSGGTTEGYAAKGGTNGLTNSTIDNIIHESFHLIGFDERYADARAILKSGSEIYLTGTHPGFDGDVLQGWSSSSGDILKSTSLIHAVHHHDIVSFAFENSSKFKNGTMVLAGQYIDDTNQGAKPSSAEKLEKVNKAETTNPTKE